MHCLVKSVWHREIFFYRFIKCVVAPAMKIWFNFIIREMSTFSFYLLLMFPCCVTGQRYLNSTFSPAHQLVTKCWKLFTWLFIVTLLIINEKKQSKFPLKGELITCHILIIEYYSTTQMSKLLILLCHSASNHNLRLSTISSYKELGFYSKSRNYTSVKQ